MSEAPAPVSMPPKGKGVPPPKGLGKGMPPPVPGGTSGKGPMLPRGAVHQPPSIAGPRLRPLFWTSVSQVPAESVWADLVEPAPFDKALLERQFALAKVQTPSSARAASGQEGGNVTEEARKRVRVLDDRSSQLLAIAFNRLPPPERVAEMVNTLEDFPDGLTSEAVLALHGAVTEHGEAMKQIQLIASGQDAINQLDMPERFLLRLSSVDFCSAKLACGALLVGSAKELMDLRLCGQKVGVCCQDLRKSKLLQKCMSTALAVGNFLNRGTARSGVRAVVLPESLMKLEELRGGALSDLNGDGGATPSGKDKAGGTLLDFVAQAIVNEENAKADELRKEAEMLLTKAQAAAGVSLEETIACCNKISGEAAKAKAALQEVPASPGVTRMVQRVNRVCEEAALAVDIAQKAKDALGKAQLWSCCKGTVKCHDWFASWAQFLELLPRALVRAQEAKTRRLAQEEADQRVLIQRQPLGELPAPEDPAKIQMREKQAACLSLVQAAMKPKPNSKAAQQPEPENLAESKQATRSSNKSKPKQFDDEARIDNIDWSKLEKMRQENKENSVH